MQAIHSKPITLNGCNRYKTSLDLESPRVYLELKITSLSSFVFGILVERGKPHYGLIGHQLNPIGFEAKQASKKIQENTSVALSLPCGHVLCALYNLTIPRSTPFLKYVGASWLQGHSTVEKQTAAPCMAELEATPLLLFSIASNVKTISDITYQFM
jgi:hypothetical protein